MSKVDQLKAAIAELPAEDFATLCAWLTEQDWEKWDQQIAADSTSGKLDFLVREVQEEKARAELRDL